MSIDYNIPTLNARLTAVVGQIDAGAGNGVLQIQASGGTALANITFAKPCGVVAAGVLTFTTPLADLAPTPGICAGAQITDSNGTVVVSGLTVGNSTAFDIVMATTTIGVNKTIALLSATITGN